MRFAKRILSAFLNLARKAYTFAFARPSGQWFNNIMLEFAVQARGYNNHGDLSASGELAFIKLLAARNPKLCLDVGANKGEFTKALLENTTANVIAFEPLPKAVEAMKKTCAQFSERSTFVNVGVGSSESTLNLFFGEEDSPFASFSQEVNQIHYVGAANTNVMEVPVVSLDSYLQEIPEDYSEVDLLKIDTEGFEDEVLLGAENFLRVMRPKFIHMEFNWHQLFRGQTLFSLAKLMPGYRAYQLLPFERGMVYRDVTEPASNIFHYSNFVFVRGDINL